MLDSLNVETTKTLIGTLKKFGVGDELKRTRDSRKVRIGHGKVRNSRYVMRKGPLLVYGDENNFVKRTARNLPGIETCNVHRLNLLQLAPGGHLGRFVIWTKDAFAQLNNIFGSYRVKGIEKGGYVLNRHLMTCADLARIINSDQVQSKLRAVRKSTVAHEKTKRNPLKNNVIMKRLNPYNEKRRAAEKKADEERNKKRAAILKAKRKDKKGKAARTKSYRDLQNGLLQSYKDAEAELQKEENLDYEAKSESDDE